MRAPNAGRYPPDDEGINVRPPPRADRKTDDEVFFVIHYPMIYFVMAFGLTQDRVSVRAVTVLSFAVALFTCWIAAIVRERASISEYLYSLPISRR